MELAQNLDLRQILADAGIKRAIAIDDAFDKIDWQLNFSQFLNNPKQMEILNSEIPDFEVNSDPEIQQQILLEWVSSQTIESQEALFSRLMENNSVTSDDSGHFEQLSKLFEGTEVELVKCPVRDWDYTQEKSNLIDGHCIVLVDLHLENATGTQYGTEKGGLKIIKTATSQAAYDPRFIFAILSSKVDTTNEISYLEELSIAAEIEKKEMLVLSKNRIDNSAEFIDGLRMALINRQTFMIKEEFVAIIKQATEAAISDLNKISVSSFYQSVIRHAAIEGSSENEVLSRLFSILHSEKLVDMQHSTPFELNSRRSYDQMAKIGGSKEELSGDSYKKDLLALMHKERFQGSAINKLYSPIGNGDIFKFNSNYFILLSQQCDLQLRNERISSPRLVTLLRLISQNENQQEEEDSKNRISVNLFSPSGEIKTLLYTKQFIQISLDILDLVCLNENGEGTISINETFKAKKFMPALAQRFKYLYESFEKRFTDYCTHLAQIKKINSDFRKMTAEQKKLFEMESAYELIKAGDCQNVLSAFYFPQVANDRKYSPKVNIETKTIAYPISRVMRMREDAASSHLIAYAQNLSRVALPGDFFKLS